MLLTDPRIDRLERELNQLKYDYEGLASELADAHMALEQAHNAHKTLRELKETLAAQLQARVDADIATDNKRARILALAADWRKESA